LFGLIFLITQYFQVVRGYNPLRAGVATLPSAVVTGALSPVAIMVMKRIGTKLVVACGLALMSGGLLVAAITAGRRLLGQEHHRDDADGSGPGVHHQPPTDAIMGAFRGQLLGDVRPPRAPLDLERDILAAVEPRQPGPQVRWSAGLICPRAPARSLCRGSRR